MRIALLASPRCGNNWVRRVLSDVLSYPHFAAHSIDEFPRPLPSECIINIHAVNDPAVKTFLKENSCTNIVLTRHPFDIFVSVLQFARNEPAVHKWLNGSCQIPHDVDGLCPDDAEFVGWMTGRGAKNLLSVSLSWWTDKDTAIRMRYEDLVMKPRETFSGIINELGIKRIGCLEEALQKYTVSYFSQFRNHGWLGQVGSYRRFITSANCDRVIAAQLECFMTMSYAALADPKLSHRAARTDYFAAIMPIAVTGETIREWAA